MKNINTKIIRDADTKKETLEYLNGFHGEHEQSLCSDLQHLGRIHTIIKVCITVCLIVK